MSLQLPGTGPMVLPTGSSLLASPSQSDSSLAVASTEFVKAALGNKSGFVSYVTSTVNLTAADMGKEIILNTAGAVTVTIPDGTTLPAGATFNITCAASATATISIAGGGAFIYPLASGGTSFVLRPSTNIELVGVGPSTNQYITKNGAGVGNLAPNGYQRLSSGLIIQWGLTAPSLGTGDVATSFPIAFPTAVRALNVFMGNTSSALLATVGSVSNSAFGYGAWVSNTGARTAGASSYFIAIGY